MATTQQAAGNITRWADPQGDSFGVHANVSYSFWGGAGAFTGAQQTATMEAMRLWSDVAQINFFVDNADPEIGYKNLFRPGGAAGYTLDTGPGEFNPDTTHQLGFNLSFTGPLGSGRLNVANAGDQATQLGQGQVGRAILIHEIGHAIGLEHPDHAGHSRQYSSLSDAAETATGANFINTPGTPLEWWRTPLLHDIAAAQHFYGANMTTRTGDNVYGFNSNSGPQYALSSASEKAVFTIYDAGGNDTLDLSGYGIKNRWDGTKWVPYEQVINLNPNTFSDTGGLLKNMSMADAVDVKGNNSWEAGFDPNRIANYVENAIGGSERDIIYGNATGNTLRGENGNDQLWGGDGWDRLFGGAGVDDLHGGEGEDVLWGGSENDTLVGDGGNDTMFGGTGDDSYVVSDAGDNVTERPGEGIADKVYTTLNSYDMRDPAKGGNVEILQFTGEGNFIGRGNELHNILVGAGGADRLYGYAGNDMLIGGEGQDTLDGGADNDRLIGEGGADTMYGGTGDDTFVVRAGDTVIESGTRAVRDPATGLYRLVSGGTDTVETSLLRYTLDANVENLTFTYKGLGKLPSIEAFGTGNNLGNVMRGSNGRDTLSGLEGNDTLDGGRNADKMSGGADNDTYYVDNVGDVVDETYYVSGGGSGLLRFNSGYRDAGGSDTVVTTLASYDLSKVGSNNLAVRAIVPETLYGTVEHLTYTGAGVFTGTGNDVHNIITGGNGGDADHGDLLRGGGGDDHLHGLDGGDRLEGGAGADGIRAGNGNDIIVADNGTAVGGDVVLGGTGYDQVWADASVAATGFHLNLFAAGTAITGEVNLVANTSAAMEVELVQGSTGADVIDASRLGASEGVTVHGLAGNDRFIGGAGADTFNGHEDSDTFVLSGQRADYSFASDADGWSKIVHTATGSVDRIHSVETVEFANDSFATADLLAAAARITGTEGDDVLVGDAAENTIDGLGGNDTIDGAGGDDTLNGGGGNDRFLVSGKVLETGLDTVDGGADVDTIDFSGLDGSVNITLASGGFGMRAADGLSASGGSPRLTNLENIVGSAHGDTIAGDGGTNVLTGGGGADSLDAGAGDDVLHVDASDTTVKGGEGYDRVHADATTAALNFKVAGTDVEYVHGGTGADAIDAAGTSGTAILPVQMSGNDGNDTMIGGEGVDWFWGGQGIDTAVFTGSRADYTVTQDPDAWYGWSTVTHNTTGIRDWVISVEKLQFADGTVDAPGLRAELVGTATGDVITGGEAAAEIHGGAGNDQLTGGAQDDIVNGGAGADELRGGNGNDDLFVDSADTVIDGGEGYDAVYADPGLAETGLNFKAAGTNVELVWGSMAADVIDATGVTSGIYLDGSWGDDVLIGGDGADVLTGNEGVDTAVFTGNRADYAFEAAAEDGVKVTHTANGTSDWIYTVEHLKFADGTFATSAVLV